MSCYPLKFKPIYKEKVWGGRQLERLFSRTLPPQSPIGESWEISDIPSLQEDVSVIANGPLAGKTLYNAINIFGADLLGNARAVQGHFPLLIKYLDAQENLSVQVHPTAQYVAEHSDTYLKTEAWYVLHAEPGAVIYKGVKPGVDRRQFEAAIKENEVTDCLKSVVAKAGQCHFLPSGTVHALGKGIVVAEVQTPSDSTFRVYDWQRRGMDGKPRQLHLEESLACINFDTPQPEPPRSHVAGVFSKVTRLVLCKYFLMEKISFLSGIEQDLPYDDMAIWMVLKGEGTLRYDLDQTIDFQAGETLLIPAGLKHGYLLNKTDTEWLEITIPRPGSKSLIG